MVVHMDVWMSVCIGHKNSEYTYQHDLLITSNLPANCLSLLDRQLACSYNLDRKGDGLEKRPGG